MERATDTAGNVVSGATDTVGKTASGVTDTAGNLVGGVGKTLGNSTSFFFLPFSLPPCPCPFFKVYPVKPPSSPSSPHQTTNFAKLAPPFVYHHCNLNPNNGGLRSLAKTSFTNSLNSFLAVEGVTGGVGDAAKGVGNTANDATKGVGDTTKGATDGIGGKKQDASNPLGL